MEKLQAIADALYIICPNVENILSKYRDSTKNSNLRTEQLLAILAKSKYNLKVELNISSGTLSKLLKELFPERATGSKPCTWILAKVELKFCSSCELVKSFEEFRQNTIKSQGLQTLCKACHSESTAKTQAYRQSLYRAKKLQRTPIWADLEKIKDIYNNCPKGCHVDHIIPLNGEQVSGLHVPENLQYLPAAINCSKSNKFAVIV